jgi:hypothetical protein
LVKSIYLVVSGELLLDTGDIMHDGKLTPFRHSVAENCYHLSSGSILGDEGVTGLDNTFESTSVVVSDVAVIFEVVGFGMRFLTDKILSLRYSALAYKNKSRWTPPISLAEQMNPYTYFDSLRKSISYVKPYRGTVNSNLSQFSKRQLFF